MVFKPLYKVGLDGARGTVSWTISRGMIILKYTMVVRSVTAIGVNEKGLVQFMRAIFGRMSDGMELFEAVTDPHTMEWGSPLVHYDEKP